jgi:hypothetical protein
LGHQELRYSLFEDWADDPSENVEDDVGVQVMTRFDEFINLVQRYSARQLTYGRDALNALSEVTQHLKESGKIPIIYSMAGLPWLPGDYLCISLSRYHEPHIDMEIRRQHVFPSSTWAGWTGLVCWNYACPLRTINITSRIQDLAYGPASNSTMNPGLRDTVPSYGRGLSQPLAQNDSHDTQDWVKELHFSVPVIPCSQFSIRAPFISEKIVVCGDVQLWGARCKRPFPDCVYSPSTFLENVESGLWSCRWLGEQRDRMDWVSPMDRLLLVVQ